MKRYDYLLDAFAISMTAVQLNQVFQVISLVLTILATLCSTAISILNVIQRAKENNKRIEEEDVKEIAELLGRTTEELKNEIGEHLKDKNGGK